jgi:hypothetical protein
MCWLGLICNVISSTSFPKLLWVVRDFVQDTNGLTPTEWLHSLLHSRRRDATKETDRVSLLSLFPSVEAFTLSLPAAETHILRRLDLAKNDTLTQDYKRGIEQLRRCVFNSITPKLRGGSPLSGFGKEMFSFLCIILSPLPSHILSFSSVLLSHTCSLLSTRLFVAFFCRSC